MTDDGELVEIPTKRVDALLETLEEMSGKVIIWSRFRYDIRKITVMLESKYGPDPRSTTSVIRPRLTDKQPSNSFSSEMQGSSLPTHRRQAMA